MSGGRIDPRAVPSSNLRAQIIGAMLGGPKGSGRYLFVLDGLEVMQHEEEDQYGLLQSNDLRDLLTFFARPDNQSFCLITSRAPLLDLMDYTTYTHRDVDRLSEEDGRALLRKLGVKGNDNELNKVVADWDGHALTLSILAAYLAERYEGDVHFAHKIRLGEKKWEKDVPEQYKHVSRILRRYDEHLSEAEKSFLRLFSAFRIPIHSTAFKTVFRKKTYATSLNESLTKLRKPQFDALVERLIKYRIIRHDTSSNTYTTHPLIRNHYFALLTKRTGKRGNVTRANVKLAHEQIKDYYLSIAGDTPEYPTLDDLKPLIEVVHHACQAGAYDEAFNLYCERIQKLPTGILVYQLGAHDTDLNTLSEFFPDRDMSQEPQVSISQGNESSDRGWILNEIGLSLMSLGRPRESVPFYGRHNKICSDMQDWGNASVGCQNLADVHASLGALEASATAARQALDLARRAEMKVLQCYSLAFQGLANHLLGDIQIATDAFAEAEKLEQENYLSENIRYLFSLRGINHANHLRRINQADYARRVTEANLQICEQEHWADHTSQCYRVLGDLDSDAGNHESAREHYESALKIARGISNRYVLIEALLARGLWQAKYMKDANAGFNDLNEALGYCVESGYRIYEADVRIALGWAYLANGEKEKAKESAERALQMSNEMGYHWGKVDAEEALKNV